MGHYYEATPEAVVPRHFVTMKDRPDLRPTRITDVRKWWREGKTVVPSVTTVLDVLAKHALVNWKIEQYLSVAYIYRNERDLPLDNWMVEVKDMTELEMDKAPSAGTDLHKLMEQFVVGKLSSDHDWWEFCHGVYWEVECATEIENDDGMGHYKPEVSFVSDMGYGGQVDLVIADQWLIDYKTKQTADKFKPGKMAYPEHRMQLAAYSQGLNLPNARCANVFISLEDGRIDFHEHKESELEHGWKLFQHALEIWKLQNDWHSYMEQAE